MVYGFLSATIGDRILISVYFECSSRSLRLFRKESQHGITWHSGRFFWHLRPCKEMYLHFFIDRQVDRLTFASMMFGRVRMPSRP